MQKMYCRVLMTSDSLALGNRHPEITEWGMAEKAIPHISYRPLCGRQHVYIFQHQEECNV